MFKLKDALIDFMEQTPDTVTVDLDDPTIIKLFDARNGHAIKFYNDSIFLVDPDLGVECRYSLKNRISRKLIRPNTEIIYEIADCNYPGEMVTLTLEFHDDQVSVTIDDRAWTIIVGEIPNMRDEYIRMMGDNLHDND
jgi:hypothetical protein